ncbi:hypothetical protein [Candidatus Stoquefichus massiliensis]|uniref:hypothetical protein n=1 Tax=Candidatus Stoquefichus massiliensis TaxID=1470350 RepID=UPI000481D7ED|nr:hypothetical protein [Candidatus Stoquefichus massiliensis]
MYIDTKSEETIRKSLNVLLNVSNNEIDGLLENCYKKLQMNHQFLDMDNLYEYFALFVKEHLCNNVDEVMLIHLSRRLNNDTNNDGYNLIDVLTKDSSLSHFLKSYGLTFQYDQYIKMYIKDREIDISDSLYLKDRFGYRFQDYSIGGYAFMDHIEDSDYYNIACGGPEFFGYLYPYDIDIDAIIDDFIANSTFYQFKYVLPLKDIEFESYEELDEDEKMYHIIIRTLQRLYFDKYDPLFNKQDNTIMKMKGDRVLSSQYLINKIELNNK